MKFTKNEKEVLKLLLDNGRISDVDIANTLNISTQAVGKIRKKLEENRVIEGYSCNLNYEKLGLNIFSLSLMKMKQKYWEEFGDIKGRDLIKQSPRTILSCITTGSEVNVIVLRAFRDIKEMDRYFHLVNTTYHDHTELVNMYPFSTLNFMKNTPAALFKLLLDDRPIVPLSKEELKK